MISNQNRNVNLINSNQIVLSSSSQIKTNHNKNSELKKAIKMALQLKTKVDEYESEENKKCICGGNYLKGIYNYKDIIVCDTCHRTKFFKSIIEKKYESSRRDFSLNQNEQPKKLFYSKNIELYNKNNVKNNSVYRKPIVKLPFDLSRSLSKNKTSIEQYEKKKGNLLNTVNDLTFRSLLKNYYANTIETQKEISKNNEENNKNNNNNDNNKNNNNNNENENNERDENEYYELSSDLNMNEYKMLKLIGNGSYANIYLVEHIKTKIQYAVKKIITDGENELEKIKLEINIIKALQELDKQNKYFVHIYKYSIKKLDVTSNSIYFLMPLAISDWGKQIQNNNIFFNEKILIKILKNCSAGLSIMQYKNIAHRDIKPQNILMMNNGNYLLCDFDECIFVKKAYGSFDIRGTEMFMSPILENSVYSGNKKAKFNIYKSDVYSLGLCFVYAITKEFDILNKIRKCNNDEMNKNLILNNIAGEEEYTNNFISIIMRMIAFNEKDRVDCIQLNSLVNESNL